MMEAMVGTTISKPKSDKKDGSGPSQSRTRFNPEEDARLLEMVSVVGHGNWAAIARAMHTRTARQCRDRFKNFLNPNLRVGDWTEEEDDLLMRLYSEKGSDWNIIAKEFKNRSRISVRNRYYLVQRKRSRLQSQAKESEAKPEKVRESDVASLLNELIRSTSHDGFSEQDFCIEFGHE